MFIQKNYYSVGIILLTYEYVTEGLKNKIRKIIKYMGKEILLDS
jgi:hypothetical protein